MFGGTNLTLLSHVDNKEVYLQCISFKVHLRTNSKMGIKNTQKFHLIPAAYMKLIKVERLYFITRSKSILSVNEKLPVSKFRYFKKYIIQLFGY